MKDIDLTGKCGSCYYFHPIEGTASGECHKFPYGDDVVHDVAHPFFQPGRSRIKCKNYRTTPITNADHIRSMTDEELVELFADNNCGYCRIHDFCFAKGCQINCEDVWLDWLQEVSNG